MPPVSEPDIEVRVSNSEDFPACERPVIPIANDMPLNASLNPVFLLNCGYLDTGREGSLVRIRAAGLSHAGRRKGNEDHFCIGSKVLQNKSLSAGLDIPSREFEQFGFLAAVADGIGGEKGGQFASWMALEALHERYFQRPARGETGKQLLKRVTRCLADTCKSLQAELKKKNFHKGGTTVAGVVMKHPNHLICFHVGDSRVMQMLEGDLSPLTIDHTPVGEALARGKMTEEEALARPDCNQLTRSFGLGGNVQAEVRLMTFHPGDHILIATDGFHSPGRGLGSDFIVDFIGKERRLGQQVHRLVEYAVDRDGSDNTTLVIVRVDQATEAWAKEMFPERRQAPEGKKKKRWWFW